MTTPRVARYSCIAPIGPGCLRPYVFTGRLHPDVLGREKSKRLCAARWKRERFPPKSAALLRTCLSCFMLCLQVQTGDCTKPTNLDYKDLTPHGRPPFNGPIYDVVKTLSPPPARNRREVVPHGPRYVGCHPRLAILLASAPALVQQPLTLIILEPFCLPTEISSS